MGEIGGAVLIGGGNHLFEKEQQMFQCVVFRGELVVALKGS